MSKKLKGKILALLGKNYEAVVSEDLFNSFFESQPLEKIEDEYTLESPLKGISLILSDSLKIIAIQLYSDGLYGYQQYKGDGIDCLSFDMSQEQVHDIFGQPIKSEKAGQIPILGHSFPWDRYEYENACLHCEYFDDFQTVRLITISTPE